VKVIPRTELAHHFGRVLKSLRKDAGLSQEDLAARAECDRTYPSLLERGLRTPTLDVLFKLCDGLKIDAAGMVRMTQDRLTGKSE
jgi:transcriptional regulator with XRE-family HTH domain